MAAALPVTKLAGLLMKTLAKPLSKRIKHEFSRYHYTQQLLISIGQTSHAITSRMTIWSAGYTVRSITPLESEKAMSTGAEFVGESFILFVSGVVVVWEYNRSKEKERAHDAKLRAEAQAQRDALREKLVSLDARLKTVESVVEANTQSILNFRGKTYVAPTHTVSMVDEDDDKENKPVPLTADAQVAENGDESDAPEDAKQASTPKWLSWRPW